MHSIIQHQSRLDAKWYRRTVTELDKYTSLVPKRFDGEQRERLCATLFIEILAVAASSHMLHMAFLCLGERDMPPLSKLPAHISALQPSYLDIQTAGMLKRKRSFRNDIGVVHAPFVLSRDLDCSSDAWAELESDVQEYLLGSMVSMHPFVSLAIAPRSVYLCAQMAGEMSLPDQVVFTPWKELNPAEYCTDGFTRRDVETLMVATAEAYGTDF